MNSVEISAHPLAPFDMLEIPGHVQPRLYRIDAVSYGALEQEGVVEIVAIDRTAPDAYGTRASMFVPIEMIEAGLTAGIFTLTKP